MYLSGEHQLINCLQVSEARTVISLELPLIKYFLRYLSWKKKTMKVP